jgi:hypothetical protein
MKFTQKTKYFIFGAIATAVLVPLGTYAVKTIPVTFAEGDVVSASVMNALMSRINEVQQGFTSVTDLDGAWSCTTYSRSSDGCSSAGTLLYSKTGTMTFTSSSKSFSYTGTGDPRGCFVGGYLTTGNYDIQSGYLVTDYGVYEARRKSPTEFLWTLTNSMPPSGYTVCTKTATAPSPADVLTATVSGTSVALTWTDQSTDETGFKVQYKTSAKGSWTTATTTAANTTSYTLNSLTAGTYWIRVVAKNTNGDSMSSSEVQAVVQ